MKHLTVLSTEQPAKAQETAWIQVKDLIASNYNKGQANIFGVPGNMSTEQVNWLAAQWDNALQK
jgi:hypothetical protein